MRILLATSWNTPCGIAAHSEMLIEAVRAHDPSIRFTPSREALDPEYVMRYPLDDFDILHLNHHDALHSRWNVDYVRQIEANRPVVITYHDTREYLTDTPKLVDFRTRTQAAIVVHEPVHGLVDDPLYKLRCVHYWRQGIPAPADSPLQFGLRGDGYDSLFFKRYSQQPVLGTVGFNFPWKNYDKLCEETRKAGWAIIIMANNATQDDVDLWRSINPWSYFPRGYLTTEGIVRTLAGCDATAFMYECANTGTSGAIRLGIAARKPMIAMWNCRQFRDLRLDNDARRGILWAETWDEFPGLLGDVMPHPWQAETAELAHRDSWDQLGQRYIQLYHSLRRN